MTILFSNDPEERRVFDFFRNESGPSFAGYFSVPFWDSVILNIAQTEPAVKHALVALGSLHESYYRNEAREDCLQGTCYILALQQYNRAITSLTSNLPNYGSNRDLLVLSMCMLFLCFEVLQGNPEGAVIHLESGLGILQKSVNPTSSLPMNKDLEALWRLFARCDLQACSYVGARKPLLHYGPGIRSFFGSITEARHTLDQILGAEYYFLRTFAIDYRYRPIEEIPSSIYLQRQDLLALLTEWRQKLDILLSNRTSTMTSRELCAAIVLQIHHQINFIRLSTSLIPQEAFPHNAFQLEYSRIISLAESIIAAFTSFQSGQIPQMSIDMGIIQPLYLTACKCRDLSLRRRAVALIRSAGREGIWNGQIAAIAAERVIAVEESGAIDGRIPERACVHRTLIDIFHCKREVWIKHSLAASDDYTEWNYVTETANW